MNADRITEVYEGALGGPERQRGARRRIHWMCRQAAGENVLDIGCSQGIVSILLAREGHRVVGVDNEQGAITFATQRLADEAPAVRERATFRLAEAGALPFDDAAFDTVILGELLEHQVDPRPVIGEAARVLRPGGCAVITTPYGIFPYPDHKEPLYLRPLLEMLGERFAVSELELLGAYLAMVATPRAAGEPVVDLARALAVAELRLVAQDEALEAERHHRAARSEELDLLRAEVAALRDRPAGAEAEDAHVDEAAQRLAAQCEAAERLRDELAGEAAEMRTARDELAGETAKLRAERDGLADQAAELQRIGERDGRLEATLAEIEAERERRLAAERRVAELEGAAGERERQVARLREERERLLGEFTTDLAGAARETP